MSWGQVVVRGTRVGPSSPTVEQLATRTARAPLLYIRAWEQLSNCVSLDSSYIVTKADSYQSYVTWGKFRSCGLF